jgi:hypothetical protein
MIGQAAVKAGQVPQPIAALSPAARNVSQNTTPQYSPCHAALDLHQALQTLEQTETPHPQLHNG